MLWFTGMHKKSVEAQQKIKSDDSPSDMLHPDLGRERSLERIGPKDVRSESIASLRAKALEHCAKITHHERRYSEHSEENDSDNRRETIDAGMSSYSSVFSYPITDSESKVTTVTMQ